MLANRVTRREFNHTAKMALAIMGVAVYGMPILISGCVGLQNVHNEDPRLNEIQGLAWNDEKILLQLYNRKSLPQEERLERLIAILRKAIDNENKDIFIARAVAEGLVPFSGKEIFEHMLTALLAFPGTEENKPYHRRIIQLMSINYCINEQARESILNFFSTRLPFLGQRITHIEIHREMYSGLLLFGNSSYRLIRKFLRTAQLANVGGPEMASEFFAGTLIQRVDPRFEPFKDDRFATPDGKAVDKAKVHEDFMVRRFHGNTHAIALTSYDHFSRKTPEQALRDFEMFAIEPSKIASWRGNLGEWQKKLSDWQNAYKMEDPRNRIAALLNLDEIEPLTDQPIYRSIMFDMLEKDNLEVQLTILSILGSPQDIDPEIQAILLKYLKSPNKELALAAARGLRFRKFSHEEEEYILDVIAQTRDLDLRQNLGDEVLSSLDSPKAFNAIVLSYILTPTKSSILVRNRVNEVHLWYLMRGDDRDERLRQIFHFFPSEQQQQAQNFLTKWIRNISKIEIFTPMPLLYWTLYPATADGRIYISSSREAEIDSHIRMFDKFARMLYPQHATPPGLTTSGIP